MAKKKDKGWIKLHRKVRENIIWESKEPFDRRSAWIDLLLMVNHEERAIMLKTGQLLTIEPGQTFTSYEILKDRWHWGSRDRVKRFLELLSVQQMATVSSTPSGTLISLQNWAFYQGASTATSTPTSQQALQRTLQRTSHEQEDIYIKNYSNKNDKKNARARAEDFSEDEFE